MVKLPAGLGPLGYRRRQYSSITNSKNKVLLHPEWITGFTDGEGSFIIKLSKVKGYRLGWKIQPVFQIKLNLRDLDLLSCIKDYFGGLSPREGGIRGNKYR